MVYSPVPPATAKTPATRPSSAWSLEKERDALAIKIKDELYAAENRDAPVSGAQGQTAACQAIIGQARQLAQST